jgi:hypothetical protein
MSIDSRLPPYSENFYKDLFNINWPDNNENYNRVYSFYYFCLDEALFEDYPFEHIEVKREIYFRYPKEEEGDSLQVGFEITFKLPLDMTAVYTFKWLDEYFLIRATMEGKGYICIESMGYLMWNRRFSEGSWQSPEFWEE